MSTHCLVIRSKFSGPAAHFMHYSPPVACCGCAYLVCGYLPAFRPCPCWQVPDELPCTQLFRAAPEGLRISLGLR
jgi:hypothetical protein